MGLDLGWRLVDCGDKTLKMGTKEEGGETMRGRERVREEQILTLDMCQRKKEREKPKEKKKKEIYRCAKHLINPHSHAHIS